MSGYNYGDEPPVEECGCCGGVAEAEYCNVGVGYVQMSAFHCFGCGAEPVYEGGTERWVRPPQPSERGELVTGYLILADGLDIETTFDQDHRHWYKRMGTSLTEILAEGGARITNLEGYAVDLPRHMSAKAKRAFAKTIKLIDDNNGRWGTPYVSTGVSVTDMSPAELISFVSRLPTKLPEPQPAGMVA